MTVPCIQIMVSVTIKFAAACRTGFQANEYGLAQSTDMLACVSKQLPYRPEIHSIT